MDSSFVELQELGVVGLIALALIPGFIWTAKAPNGIRMGARAALVAGIIVGLIATEQKLDSTADSIVNKL